jgi:adenosine deaminase
MSAAAPHLFPDVPLAELHAHISTSISPTILWEIAHESGFKLPKPEFAEFRDHIMLSPARSVPLNTYFRTVYDPLLQRLSSGSHTLQRATYYAMSGAYHKQRITRIELRTNPMKHNSGGQFDLDHIIMSILHGMERALLECRGLSAGLLLSMARDFPIAKNTVILEKALKYHRRGVVGIDVSGPGTAAFNFKDYAPLFRKAHRAGLGITVHTGEAQDANDMWEVLEFANPQRIGHGIRAAYDVPLMKELARRKVVLEICPMSNLATRAVENQEEMRHILRTLLEHKVLFCINTDWPEIIEGCRLRNQMEWLVREELLTREEILACNQVAFEASFIPKPGGLDAYL